MGYYEFPHTRNYDTDLGYLIKVFKELTTYYEKLLQNIEAYISNLLESGKLYIDAKYEDGNISFIFGKDNTDATDTQTLLARLNAINVELQELDHDLESNTLNDTTTSAKILSIEGDISYILTQLEKLNGGN